MRLRSTDLAVVGVADAAQEELGCVLFADARHCFGLCFLSIRSLQDVIVVDDE